MDHHPHMEMVRCDSLWIAADHHGYCLWHKPPLRLPDQPDVFLPRAGEVTERRVQEPHRVIINNNYLPRTVLTLFTEKDPVYLLEEEDATC